MNQREKILAAAVLGLLGLFLIFTVAGRISAGFTAKEQQISALKRTLDDKERLVARSRAAQRRMKTYEEKSLPADQETAPSLYTAWLHDLMADSGIAVEQVSNHMGRTRGDAFHLHSFTANATGNLAQLTKMLFDFYSADHLHRIKRLSITPIRDNKDKKFDLVLVVEAIALPKADHVDSLNEAPAKRLAMPTLDDYVKSIVGRNLFSPANRKPSLDVPSRQEGSPGRTLAFTARGSDPDKLDAVFFEIVGTGPSGARIDRSSGRFEWTPKEKGEFTVTIAALDNGLPVQRTEQKVQLLVTDPKPEPVVEQPKKKLEFDNAKHAFITAIVEDASGRPQTWVSIRTTGEVLKLREGDKLDIGSVQGTVQRIGVSEVEIKTTEKTVAFRIGENLLEGIAPLEDGGQ